MGLPSGFAPSLSLGGGPSQAINDGGVNASEAITGAFNVGKGRADMTIQPAPINNNTGASPGGSPYTGGSLFGSISMMDVALIAAAFFFFRKKGAG